MTKSTKHKKEFRTEKNKIKLKLSAKNTRPKIGKAKKKSQKTQFLPKGLNVTDTSFKSKKIVLPDHLRPSEDSGIPVTSRKQTFKELLSHMGHFNITIQQDGINGMKELLVKFPDILENHLSELFGKLSELVSARESGVRKCSMRLLEYIIQAVPHEKISPFFPLLNAQLMCSMNHIALDIQKDSHLLMDILITYVPDLVATVAMQVLPNFLDQISCRDDSRAGKRILAMNPNQRLTSLKWRQEVLTRIHRLLCLLLDKNQEESQAECQIVSYDQQRPVCPLYIKRDFKLKLNIQQPGHMTVSETSSPSHHLQEFISHLLPLLMETWVEAMASEQLNKSLEGSLIGLESCILLACCTNVIFTLWSVMNQAENRIELLAWFEKQYGEPFIRNFIQRFPFSARVETQKSKIKTDPHCREQNIIICFLWTKLSMKGAVKYAPSVFQYLCGIFQTADRQMLTSTELDHLNNILLTSCLKKNILPLVNDLVEAAAEFSYRIRPDRKDRLLLNKVLLNVGQSIEEVALGSVPSLNSWIETCPSLIRQDGNGALLSSINRVISRNTASLTNGKIELPHLLNSLDSYGPHHDWKAVFDFIYWTRSEGDQLSTTTDVLQRQIDRLGDETIKSYGLGVLNAIRC